MNSETTFAPQNDRSCDAITIGSSANGILIDTGETTLKCTHFCVETEEREVNLDT